MLYFKAVLLAIVEGATEFLPISSTGHLILVEEVLALSDDPDFIKTFLIIIQLPAILSVLVYFRRDILPVRVSRETRARMLTMWAKILIAVVPAMVLGLIFNDAIERNLFSPGPVAVMLIAGGIVLILVERMDHTDKFETVADINLTTALAIGLFQCVAMVPGTSRSAATIVGAILLGVKRPAAAEFSFFLAVPTMFAATGYQLAGGGLRLDAQQWGLVSVGCLVSFLTAYAVIAVFMSYIRHRSFAVFGYYRIALGAVVLSAFYLGWIVA